MRRFLVLAVISAAAVADLTGPPAGALALDESVAAGVNCVAGSYFWGRYAGKAYCVACPAGTQSTGCTACAPDPKHAACIPMGCPAGTFHEFANNACVACPAGKWQMKPGQTGCWPCPRGSFQPQEGQVGCAKCVLGTYADAAGSTQCKTCQCPAGQHGSTAQVGANSSALCACKDCAKGKYSPAGYARCGDCPAGRFQPKSKAYTCYYCPSGRYQPGEAGVECHSCSKGRWTLPQPNGGLNRKQCDVSLKDYNVLFKVFNYKSALALKAHGWTLVTAAHVKTYQSLIMRDLAQNRGVVPLGSWNSPSCCLTLASGLRLAATSAGGKTSFVLPAHFDGGNLMCKKDNAFVKDEKLRLTFHDGEALRDVTSATALKAELGAGICSHRLGEASPGLFMAVVPSATNCVCKTKGDCVPIHHQSSKTTGRLCNAAAYPTPAPTAFPTPAPTPAPPTPYPTPAPVNCAMSAWTTWASCSMSCGSGSMTRERHITTSAAHGGLACPHRNEARTCNEHACPTDCRLSDWSTWETCSVSCGGGVSRRERSVDRPNRHGGVSCGALAETRSCNSHDCPSNCEISPWSEWKPCSVSCGTGVLFERRTVTKPAQHGGQDCTLFRVRRLSCDKGPCPIDCLVAQWGQWSACTKSCSSGTQRRERMVLVRPHNYGEVCPSLEETRTCNDSPCATDCTLSDWGAWDTCSVSCGGGMMQRARSVTRAPANGGKQCDRLRDEKDCNKHACPTDCVMTQWTSWTDCTQSCGGGMKSRYRSTSVAPDAGGKACPTDADGTVCNTHACPEDCTAAPWGAWSACTASCATGSRKRERVLVQPKYGGAKCPHQYEAESCNEHACPTPAPTPAPPTPFPTPAPIDCQMHDWGAWTACSKSCGTGHRTRTRGVATTHSHGGVTCPHNSEALSCNVHKCPVDCKLGEWSVWTTCSRSCESGAMLTGGSQTRTRPLIAAAQYGGKCEPLSEARNCNAHRCPVDCQQTEFGQWTACSTSCGDGFQARQRLTTTQPSHGGKACRHASETKMCRLQPCAEHCGIGAWTEWTTCTESCGTGAQRRSRTHVQPRFGGKACPHSQETRPCNTHCCPVNCALHSWSSWSTCTRSCGSGFQNRARGRNEHACGGNPCSAHASETRGCNVHECAVDCGRGQWDAWTTCTKSCGGGHQSRTRVHALPRFGGALCPHSSETRVCNGAPCPIDCELSQWAPWSACSVTCHHGTEHRVRTIQRREEFGGNVCDATHAEQACDAGPCPSHCQVSVWSSWTACGKSCGGGHQSRSRSVVHAAQHGGYQCPFLSDVRSCNDQGCPVDCAMPDFSPTFGQCTVTCGGGFQSRTRVATTLPSAGGKACPHSAETKQCNSKPCPVDCVVSDWGTWTSCSLSCGGGKKSRSRSVTTAVKFGGVGCGQLQEETNCGILPCPVDCFISDWSSWSTCTKSCGSGFGQRTRVLTQARHGGKQCPHGQETRPCNTHNCAKNCMTQDWTSWSTCTKSCGGGSQKRERSQTEPLFGGKACPHYSETRQCNTHACPTDCVLTQWGMWSTCTKSCGSGAQSRSKSILTDATHGGAPCVPPTAHRACNAHACPIDCQMATWSSWSVCSTSCGAGARERTRNIARNPSYGGMACSTQLIDTERCTLGPCPVHCRVSPFSAWSTCGKSCGGGQQHRDRMVISLPDHGGYVCPYLAETRECNTFSCPVDCSLAAWGTWSTCTKSCGGGQQERARGVVRPAAFGGSPCAATKQSRNCNVSPCGIDCAMNDWSSWGTCTRSCGTDGAQARWRGVRVAPQHGGKACAHSDETRPCNAHPCPSNCIVNEFSQWSTCTKSCGGGSQQRSRGLTQPEHGGAACPHGTETRACNTAPCAVDCVLDKFGEWSQCSRSCSVGNQMRERLVLTAPMHGGKACAHTHETQECTELQNCPVDCVLSQWAGWSTCTSSCGGGSQQRVRQVNVQAQHGGVACSPTRTQVRSCNAHQCPQNCVTTQWEQWTTCSISCGATGSQTRYRLVTQHPRYGGNACPATTAIRACYQGPCPVHCATSAFSYWTPCTRSCGGGKQSRSRSVITAARHGGYVCPYLDETRKCNQHVCPLDCKLSGWATWATCSRSCGGGQQSRSRDVLIMPANGGASCEHTAEQRQCNSHACPVDCRMSDWGAWSVCTHSCNGGNSHRLRDVDRDVAAGGKACLHTHETKACNTHKCPVNCVVSDWGTWGTCSQSCGSGEHDRQRSATTLPAHGGKLCPALMQTQHCNTHACPVDCMFGAWGSWGECSEPCGGGKRSRAKPVFREASYGGKPCPKTPVQIGSCNTQSCACEHVRCDFAPHPHNGHYARPVSTQDVRRIRVLHHGKESHMQHHCKFDYVMNDCVCRCFDSKHFAYDRQTAQFHRTAQSLAGATPAWLRARQEAERQAGGAQRNDAGVEGVVGSFKDMKLWKARSLPAVAANVRV